MIHRLLCSFVLLVIVGVRGVQSLSISSNSLAGTETLKSGLTQKQLGLVRWFAQLTILQPNLSSWEGWGEDVVSDVHCDGNTCIRYELASVAYAAAIIATKTPAFTSLAEDILVNTIDRMIQKIVWNYVEVFDDFKKQPTYPDPVAYKNIMYSGHLAQMITLLEAVFGNFKYSVDGWYFAWGEDTEYPVAIHYNTSKLIDAVYQQSLVYDGLGGVPCEPDSIFVICNNYPQVAFLLYDAVHGGQYSIKAAPVWHKTVVTRGVNRVPFVGPGDNNYFNLDYLLKPFGIWEPIATVGSDVWALAWMKAWWPNLQENMHGLHDKVLDEAFISIRDSSRWQFIRNASESEQNGLYPQAFLEPNNVTENLFPFPTFITTSFWPMLQKQFDSRGIGTDRSQQVLRYFENSFAENFDSDGDTVTDSYRYNSCDATCLPMSDQPRDCMVDCGVGHYSIWASSNLLIGMLMPDNETEFLVNLVRGLPKYKITAKLPKVDAVNYPNTMVSVAEYTFPNSIAPYDNYHRTFELLLTIVAGDRISSSDKSGNDVVIRNVPVRYLTHPERLRVNIDGNVFTNFSLRLDTKTSSCQLILHAPSWSFNVESTADSYSFTISFN